MSSEANQHALARLARLLRRRHSRQGGRDFVVLGVDGGETARASSDDLVTQQMPVMRNAR
ncbi:MAG: hypothetical protein ABIY55_21665 [Kofleriaceae bacterium]